MNTETESDTGSDGTPVKKTGPNKLKRNYAVIIVSTTLIRGEVYSRIIIQSATKDIEMGDATTPKATAPKAKKTTKADDKAILPVSIHQIISARSLPCWP